MSWWLLWLFLFFVWFLWAIAATLQTGIENVRHPLPDGQRRGMSPAPVIPLFPAVLRGIAKLIDYFIPSWGTIVIGSLHAAFAGVLIASIVRSYWRLRLLTVKPTDEISRDKPS